MFYVLRSRTVRFSLGKRTVFGRELYGFRTENIKTVLKIPFLFLEEILFISGQ